MNSQALLIINIILAAGAAVLAVFAWFQFHRLERMRKSFSSSTQPVNLDEVLNALVMRIKTLEHEGVDMAEHIAAIRSHLGFAVQKIGLVRFNSFSDEGGNLSFVCALLNEHNDGVVLTSMNGRQQNRIYSKPIINGASDIPLSEDEQQAVQNAGEDWLNQMKKSTTEKQNARTHTPRH